MRIQTSHKKKRTLFLCLLAMLITAPAALAQDDKSEIAAALVGQWDGSVIRQNASQRLRVRFYLEEGKLLSLQELSEWHPAFGEFVRPLEVGKDGTITGIIGLGKASVLLDRNNLEINGRVLNSSPTIYIHLKKTPSEPTGYFSIEPVNVVNNNVTLNGHLHSPAFGSRDTAVIYVGGRGCYAGRTNSNLHAKFLRKYGVSVLALEKRGTGKSTGDCEKSTIDELASDVVAAERFLRQHPNGYGKIGAIGESAGGWVIFRAAEIGKLDFLISIVGPSTSVRDQQMQSMAYGVPEFKLSESAKDDLFEYTKMMFDAPATDASFARFSELLENAKRDKWIELLENTDKPSSVNGIGDLWVRRHSYDPFKSLSAFKGPVLAMFGENDWIVPYRENIERLNMAFEGPRKSLVTIVSAYGADHGMTVGDKYVSLKPGFSYWRFFRVSPRVRIEMLEFLRKHQLTRF